ncbi:MAG TPA: hypothetical protein DEG44_02285, partial [Candidatus Kerfeldbacteria bacterium]|nr:hypothetical protein [Candidatus Kerfeldbacteria bacterium]
MKKLFFGLSITLALLGAGCLPDKNTPSLNTTVSDTTNFTADELAEILLYEVDVLGRVYAVRPKVVEFNGNLDLANDGSDYYIARVWLDELTGATAMTEAMTKYSSPEIAEEKIIELAGDNERLQAPQPVGDTWVVYATPANDTEPASVTYRMTVEQYGVRITVFDRGSDTQDDLLELANDLAVTQLRKIGDALVLGVTLSENAAIDALPAAITGAEYMGTSFVTAEEWLGTIYDLDSEGVDGFVTGGIRRWQLQSRSNEVVEVVVMEMESDALAAEYVAEFLPSLPNTTEIALPASIADQADAVVNVTAELVELQASQDNYVVDLSIFAPLGVADLAAAQDELVTIAEEVLTGSVTSTTSTTTTTVSEYPDVTADQLALALPTPDDVATAVSDVHPLPLEFNGQLDPNLKNYNFYLGQLWNDADSNRLLATAITQYTSAEAG